MFRNFKLLFIVVFSMKYVNMIEGVCFVNETSLSSFESARSDVREVNDIPEVLVDVYHADAKGDGSLQESSKRSISTVHGFTGQVTSMHNGVVFNLTKIGMKERILSAKIHVMIAATGGQSPLPTYSHLVLYDQFNRRPVHKVQFQESGARWVVLPAVSLVRRWVFSERLNRGVYFKLLGHSLDKSLSVRVIADLVDSRDNRPLLIVETLPSKAKLRKDIQSLISPRQMPRLTHKSRRPRAVRDEGPCSIRPMKVHFKKHLNLDVLFPTSFDSFRCGGKCEFPLDASVNPSGHAIIRAILHSSGMVNGVGEPCCVPIKLQEIRVFMRNANKDIVIKSFQDMIIKECGCR